MLKMELEEDVFYAALGKAVTQWAAVEHNLFDLYQALIKSKNWTILSASYHVVSNFRTKLDIF